MGAGRALSKLHAQYTTKDDQTRPPTGNLSTLKEWSTRFAWQGRAELYDKAVEAEKTRLAGERRRQAMEEGLALDYERVRKLRKLARKLERELRQEDRVWLPDVKQIGSGEDAERVDIVRFNAPLIEQYRGTLDDLAKETGGRKKQTEISGPGGKPIQVSGMTDEQLEAVAVKGLVGADAGDEDDEE
jgi:hypothetical protein